MLAWRRRASSAHYEPDVRCEAAPDVQAGTVAGAPWRWLAINNEAFAGQSGSARDRLLACWSSSSTVPQTSLRPAKACITAAIDIDKN